MPNKNSNISADQFDPLVLASNATDALAAVSQAAERGAALVEAWVAAGNAAAVQEIAERGQGAARKAARRGLGILRSRGVPIPERERRRAGTTRAKATHRAWLLPPDASGTALLCIAAESPGARSRASIVFHRDLFGIVRLENVTLASSKLQSRLISAAPKLGYEPIEVPADFARARVAALRRSHQERGIPEPLGMRQAAELLEPVPDAAVPHPFDTEGFELSDQDARALAAESAKLHALPEFRAWLPSQASMQELLLKVGEKLTPGEPPDPETLNQHLIVEIASATDRYFTPEHRALLVDRMKDSALSALARDGEGRGLELAATMARIAAAGLITDPPNEVPFLRGFFEKAVSLMVAQGGGRLRIPVPNAALEQAATTDEAPATDSV